MKSSFWDSFPISGGRPTKCVSHPTRRSSREEGGFTWGSGQSTGHNPYIVQVVKPIGAWSSTYMCAILSSQLKNMTICSIQLYRYMYRITFHNMHYLSTWSTTGNSFVNAASHSTSGPREVLQQYKYTVLMRKGLMSSLMSWCFLVQINDGRHFQGRLSLSLSLSAFNTPHIYTPYIRLLIPHVGVSHQQQLQMISFKIHRRNCRWRRWNSWWDWRRQ
jgi:hypothetical protein